MKDKFTKSWIIENSIEITDRYEPGILTLRSLHYQLVSVGMTNDINHYKRVVNAMISARWDNIIPFKTFSDLDREMVNETKFMKTSAEEEIRSTSSAIEYWMENYSKNRWENQDHYPEVFIEKKALQGVFASTCSKWDVALGACKGYPSLTFLHEAAKRFTYASELGKFPVILYFGDYDPSGEDIPRSIKENLSRFGVDVGLERVALMEEQVIEMSLPPAPAKSTDTRTAKWGGLGQVELDAVQPEILMKMVNSALESVFDHGLYTDLLKDQESEKVEYIKGIKEFIKNIDN